MTSVHIGECSGALINRRHYERFVIPFASRLGRELAPIRWHSCGLSDHLLAAIAGIDNLQVLDTGSNTSVAAIRRLFGPDFRIDVAPPVEVLVDTAPQAGISAWLERVLEENAGGPLLIGYHFEPGYSLANCLFIHDELARRGEITKGRAAGGH